MEDLGVEVTVILKHNLKKKDGRALSDFIGLRIGANGGLL